MNTLNIYLEGKYVKTDDGKIWQITGGFGCDPNLMGSALYAQEIATGATADIRGHDYVLATDEEVSQAQTKQEKFLNSEFWFAGVDYTIHGQYPEIFRQEMDGVKDATSVFDRLSEEFNSYCLANNIDRKKIVKLSISISKGVPCND